MRAHPSREREASRERKPQRVDELLDRQLVVLALYLGRIEPRGFNLGLGRVAGLAAGASTICFVLGSSSVSSLKDFGGQARWVALVALWLVAVVGSLRRKAIGFPSGPARVAIVLGGALLGLAFLSAAWSGDPRLTLHRASSFGIAVTAVAALAAIVGADHRVARNVATGLVGAVAVVNAVGFFLLLVDSSGAAQPRSVAAPWRFQGLGENPNTISMLSGITLPLALWAVLTAKSRRARRMSGAALALSFAAITLSGSRGAIAAGAVGAIAFILSLGLPRRRTLRLTAAVGLGTIACLALSQIPRPARAPAARATASLPAHRTLQASAIATASSRQSTPPAPFRSPPPGDYPYADLAEEVGRPAQGGRTLFSSSGRLQAWQGAIGQGNARFLLGYGFGTEQNVFFDRYQTFESAVTENSFVGLYLQLGTVGVLVFIGLLAVVATAGIRGREALDVGRRPILAAMFGVFVGGLVLMCVQSYAYSVGNVSNVPFWLSAGFVVANTSGPLGGRAASPRPTPRELLTAAVAAALLIGLLLGLGRWQKDRAIARTGRAMESLAAIPGPDLAQHLSGSRIAAGRDCLLYSVDRYPPAVELCFSADGHLTEAIDRRRGMPRFLSMLDEPEASPVQRSVPLLLSRFHDTGALLDIPSPAPRLPIGGSDYAAVLVPPFAAAGG